MDEMVVSDYQRRRTVVPDGHRCAMPQPELDSIELAAQANLLQLGSTRAVAL